MQTAGIESVRMIWERADAALSVKEILTMTEYEGISVGQYVSFLDRKNPGLLKEWAARCVLQIRPFIEHAIGSVNRGDQAITNPLGHFNTCDPDVGRKLAHFRFRKVINDQSPKFIQLAFSAHVEFGLGFFQNAVTEVEYSLANKRLPGFDYQLANNSRKAHQVFEGVMRDIATNLIIVSRQRQLKK